MSSIIKEAGLSGDERTCDRERYFLNQLIVETLITKFISDSDSFLDNKRRTVSQCNISVASCGRSFTES